MVRSIVDSQTENPEHRYKRSGFSVIIWTKSWKTEINVCQVKNNTPSSVIESVPKCLGEHLNALTKTQIRVLHHCQFCM